MQTLKSNAQETAPKNKTISVFNVNQNKQYFPFLADHQCVKIAVP